MADANQARHVPGSIAHNRFPALLRRRNIVSDIVQGIIAGGVLAFITFRIIGHAYVTEVNGWTTIYGCGVPGNGILLRGACGAIFPGPINVPQEATYWTTKVDGQGRHLSGHHDYVMHFPPGGIPPNNAFWSLTMADSKNQFAANSINRYNVGDRSGLASNADGSIDIYIQHEAPANHESNWLPAPSGNFLLWLRAYLPGQKVLDGKYNAPPVVETR